MNHIQQNENELYHYGVVGMRWGVRRASKKLSRATDSATRDSAIQTLNNHKAKGSAKLTSLEKKRVKLDDKLRKATTKDKVKATKLEAKAAKLDRKAAKKIKTANKWWVSHDGKKNLILSSQAYKLKADNKRTKAAELNANYEKVKAKVDANESMQKAFKTELRNIDQALIENGRRYING